MLNAWMNRQLRIAGAEKGVFPPWITSVLAGSGMEIEDGELEILRPASGCELRRHKFEV
jgi:hypothetical protein